MKKFFTVAILTTAMLFNTASAAPAPAKDRETIYQIALLQSLAMGYFDGSISVKDLKINVVADKVTVPFSNVTFFDKDFSVKLADVQSKDALEKIFNEQVAKYGRNSFYMIKLSGTFNEVLIRSESGQKEPYPTLVEALKTQNEISPKNIKGTIVGLYCPDFMSSLNSTGWHFHFISADKKIGGHVLELNLKSGEAQFDKTDNFLLNLPTKENFHALNFKKNMTEDIRKAEQDVQGGK